MHKTPTEFVKVLVRKMIYRPIRLTGPILLVIKRHSRGDHFRPRL
jgi:hypothetical protein